MFDCQFFWSHIVLTYQKQEYWRNGQPEYQKNYLLPPTTIIFSRFTNFQLHTGSLKIRFLPTFLEKNAKKLFASNDIRTGKFFWQQWGQWSKIAAFCCKTLVFWQKERLPFWLSKNGKLKAERRIRICCLLLPNRENNHRYIAFRTLVFLRWKMRTH